MSMSLLLAAMIVGSALIVSADRTLGLGGFAISVILAAILIIRMIFS